MVAVNEPAIISLLLKEAEKCGILPNFIKMKQSALSDHGRKHITIPIIIRWMTYIVSWQKISILIATMKAGRNSLIASSILHLIPGIIKLVGIFDR